MPAVHALVAEGYYRAAELLRHPTENGLEHGGGVADDIADKVPSPYDPDGQHGDHYGRPTSYRV